MWLIEVHVLGRTFTRRIGDHRSLNLAPRMAQLRQLTVRLPRTAA